MFEDDDITPASVTSTNDAPRETVAPPENATDEIAEGDAGDAGDADADKDDDVADDTKEEEEEEKEEPEVGDATPVEE